MKSHRKLYKLQTIQHVALAHPSEFRCAPACERSSRANSFHLINRWRAPMPITPISSTHQASRYAYHALASRSITQHRVERQEGGQIQVAATGSDRSRQGIACAELKRWNGAQSKMRYCKLATHRGS